MNAPRTCPCTPAVGETLRVEFYERRKRDGFYLVIGEWNGAAWRFWERDTYEVRWYELAATPERRARANALLQADSFTIERAA